MSNLIAKLSIANVLVLAACVPSLMAAPKTVATRPNVLFIAVDDLRPEFAAYGKDYIHSPNLSRIAARGMTFERAYCQQAVCAPSRSSLLTGTRPDTTRVYDLQTHFRKAIPDVVTLPQLFKENGYFVQGMGKLFHGGLDDPPSWSTPWSSPKMTHGTYGNPESVAIVKRLTEASKGTKKKTGKNKNYGPAFESSDVPDSTFHDGALAEMAVAALGECAKKNQPFWLGVGFIRPHLPFVAPKKYWDLYDPAQIKLAPNPFPPKGAPDYAVSTGGELRSYYGIPAGPIPDDMARQLKHGYYAAISYMDAQIGRVLDELERLGLADNTIVVVWGDHGWKLGEHAAWCKHSNVENDTNAPLLIAAPGLASAGKKSAALAEFVDIYPTLAELCSLPAPSHLEGVSLVPVLRDPQASVKNTAFSQYPRAVDGKQLMGYSMRTDRYRFTRWVHENDHSQVEAVELYDHQTDPQENVNIANDTANASLVADLTEQWTRGWKGANRVKAKNASLKRTVDDRELVTSKGTLLFEDDFERDESTPDKEAIGNGWTTNSAWRAKGAKQVDLDGGVMNVTRADVADHAVTIFHNAGSQDGGFQDGAVQLRFQLGKDGDLSVDFVDREVKTIHAGHLCLAQITPTSVRLRDSKTGVMDNIIREQVQNGKPSPELTALLKTKTKAFPRTIDPNAWHELLIVIEQDEMRVTVDGEFVGQFQSEGIAHPTKRVIALGVNKRASVDDVKLWKLK